MILPPPSFALDLVAQVTGWPPDTPAGHLAAPTAPSQPAATTDGKIYCYKYESPLE